ncbi:MAG: hypothetical protein U0441_01800 [Polyangiaceae bacterium]
MIVSGCGPQAHAPSTGGVEGVGVKKDLGSLRKRAKTESTLRAGANYFRWTVAYEGGPNESWALEDGGNPSPDIENKPGWHEDDQDVEVLAPADGAPQVALAVPDFCDAYEGVGVNLSFANMEKDFLAMADPYAVLADLRVVAYAACDRMHYEPRQKRVQRLLQTFENQSKMPLPELTKLLSALAASKPGEAFCGTDPMTRWINCGESPKDGPIPGIAKLDVMEMSGKPLDEERFRIAMTRFAAARPTPFTSHVPSKVSAPLGGVALEIAPLGMSGYPAAESAVNAAEVKLIGWDGLALTLLAKEKSLATRYLLQRRVVAWREAVDKSIAALGDKVDQVKRAEDAWRKDVLAANEAVVKAAFTAIQSPSNKEACGSVETAFAAAITDKAPTTWKAATALLANPTIDLLLQARQKCHQADGRNALSQVEQDALECWGLRALGPRMAAYRQANGVQSVRTTCEHVPARQAPEQIVKSATTKGDVVDVGFESEKWVEERESCVDTNVIDAVTWEGRIIYRQTCKDLEPITHTDPVPPASFPKAMAAGLKKGYVLNVATDAQPAVVKAYPNKKSAESDSALGVFLGVALKP